MKITDLYESDKIDNWLNDTVTGLWKRNPDGTIGVGGYVEIPEKTTKLPVQFNYVSDYFDCSYTKITSLEGAPRKIGGHFYCSYTKITSLEGAPRKIGGGFYCFNTNITDPYEYRYALLSKISGGFNSNVDEIDNIINNYGYDGTPESKKRVIQGLKLLKELSNE